MKKHSILILLYLLLTCTTNAQTKSFAGGQYGHVLNIGIGNSYYNYIGHTVPVLHANYEFQVARNITLAPFITFYRYSNSQYWGNSQNSYKSYYYHQTVIPVGVKGSYYFDELLNAGTNWDFYLAGSLGFAFRSTSWEDGFVTKSPSTTLYLLILFSIIQLIDKNVFVPKIISSSVQINAFISLIVVIISASIWGIHGMFLSIPLTAILKVIFDHSTALRPWGFLLGNSFEKL